MIELVHLGEFPSVGAVWLRYPQGGREGDYVTIGGVKYAWNKYRMCWGGASDLVKDARGKTIIEGDLDVYNDMTVGGFLRSRFGVHGGDVGTWVDEVKQALADIRASRGRAGGVAPLDEYGTVPSKHLPSQAKFEQDLRRDLADSVSPTTLRVMRILQGDPSLQFVFIQSMVSAVRVDHVVSYDKGNRVLKVPEGDSWNRCHTSQSASQRLSKVECTGSILVGRRRRGAHPVSICKGSQGGGYWGVRSHG